MLPHTAEDSSATVRLWESILFPEMNRVFTEF